MTKFGIVLLAASAFAQKQPITLENLSTAGRGSGRGAARMYGPSAWMPDGKSFLFQQGASLMLYDPATRDAKLLIDTTPIDEAAVTVPPDDGPIDWTNRRARAGGLQLSADGKSILYTASGDLFLIHTATAKWEQLTKTPVAELDAKLSPDGRMVAVVSEGHLSLVDPLSRAAAIKVALAFTSDVLMP